MRHFMAARPYSKGLIEKMSLDRKCMVTGQVLWPLLLKAFFTEVMKGAFSLNYNNTKEVNKLINFTNDQVR